MGFDSFEKTDKIQYVGFSDSNLNLLQSRKFDNLLSGFMGTSRYLQEDYYGQLQEEIEQILQIIENLLNQKK